VCVCVFLASEADSNTGQEGLRENIGSLLLWMMKCIDAGMEIPGC